MREFTRQGYAIQYHWAKRSSSDLNIFADMIAGFSRREILGIDTPDPELITKAENAIRNLRFEDPNGRKICVYQINPDGG
jgi:hypothetical protein